MNAQEARILIEAFASGQRSYEAAETVLGTLNGASGSVLFSCAGNSKFVAKGTRNQKGLVSEHVVARLGQLLEAPVGEVGLVQVPDALRVIASVQNMGAGLAHATRYIEGITDRVGLAYVSLPENRQRFARLCILYSLVRASDHQLFYSTTAPSLVYSLDHGHFFPGGPQWSIASIQSAPPAVVDPWFAAVGLTNVELAEARLRLESITDSDISNVLAGPPPEWPFTPEERNALDTFIKSRRDTLLAVVPQA